MEKACRIIGRKHIEGLVATWVRDMAQGDSNNRAMLWTGESVTELTAHDTRMMETLATRVVRLAHAGNATKFEDVFHPYTHIHPAGIIEGMLSRTSGALASTVTTHPNHAVFLSTGIWVPTVLGFDGMHDDVLFGPVFLLAPNTDHDWRLNAYSF